MSRIKVTNKYKCSKGYTHTENMTINLKDYETPEDAVKRVINEFNIEELRRNKLISDYPVDIRTFLSLESFEYLDTKLHKWEKLAGYINGLPPYVCSVSGLMKLSEWPPNETKVPKFICLTCNRGFEDKEKYENHFKIDSHLYCENSDKPHPFFSDKFNDLITDESDEAEKALYEADKALEQFDKEQGDE